LKIDSQNKDQLSQCPRCSKKFECKPNDISSCNCSKIVLSAEEYRFISSKFQICVCNACLVELKDEYNSKFHYNKPNNFKDRTFSTVLFFILFLAKSIQAQTYAPPVGQAGTSAIYMDSSVFVNWATGCTIVRGYQDISNTSLGFTTVGDNTMATGKAQSNAVVSLGDGGSAVCTFDRPIKNSAGYDFAVFENGFDDVFLELAFVEVSSDGVNFFRFHAHSLTDTTTQTGSFGSTDATKINNLAGKYRGGYGTPFDLQELAGTPGLNIDNITHVKIIDVVGSINRAYATYDFYNNKINDPWPTAFPSGGFDLDAIGVIHENTITSLKEESEFIRISIYPNPCNSGEKIYLNLDAEISSLEIIDSNGLVVFCNNTKSIEPNLLKAGVYFLRINSNNILRVEKLIVL